MKRLKVFDKKLQKYYNSLEELVNVLQKEDDGWSIIWVDIEGLCKLEIPFFQLPDGELKNSYYLLDECGRYFEIDNERFEVEIYE